MPKLLREKPMCGLIDQTQEHLISFKWDDTNQGIILYSLVVPIFCIMGIFGNILSLMVLKRKELNGSVYTYLAVLAFVDLCMSVVILFGGLSRGILWDYGLCAYDSLYGIPVGGALNTLNILATVGLTVDRVIYLWNPVRCTKPKFCHPWVARRVMFISLVVSIIFNLPYCFIFMWDKERKHLITTPFFDSTFYMAVNWITLFSFAIIPGVILLFGNGFLIISLRKARKINKMSDKCRTNTSKRRDHTNLTITLVVIIVFFLISRIPENLVSRTATINLLFQGDHDRANSCITLETIRLVCTVLGSIDVNANFIFYYTFCPPFCKILRNIIKGNSKKNKSSTGVQVNVFVLNANGSRPNTANKHLDTKVKEKVLEISRKSIESAFSLNLSDGDKEKMQQKCLDVIENDNYIAGGEYVDLDYYTPPFSTILEESSCNRETL